MIEGMQIKKIALVADPRNPDRKPRIVQAAEDVKRQCQAFGIECQHVIESNLEAVKPDEDVDVFVVLGGDGTMIHSVTKLGHFNIPFYGLNYGHVGFMMNAVQPELYENMKQLAEGRIIMWKFPLLEIQATDHDNQVHFGYGLNDVYLQRMTAQTCKINISINQQPLAFNPILCDGIIVSTPLGSTAYSYNATGSIVAIDCPCLTLTPLAANRTCPIKSLNLPLDTVIQIEALEPIKRRILVVSDGENQGNIRFAEIKVSDRSVCLCFSAVFSDTLPVRFINKCKI